MKKIYSLVALSFLTFSPALFADSFSDMAKYKPGDSNAWLFEIKADSRNLKTDTETKVLEVISNNTLSDEAFLWACDILKPIATKNSIEVLAPYLNKDLRAAAACDVLLGIDSTDVDNALEYAFQKSKTKAATAILTTMGSRANSQNVKFLIQIANGFDAQLSKVAIGALARKYNSKAVDALISIIEKNDARKDVAIAALMSQAEKAFAADDKEIAKKALKYIPEDYTSSIVLRGNLSDNPVAYFDAIIAEGKITAGMAGRAMNKGRTWENSQELIKKFPSLNKKAKLVAMGSFMLTGDTRFYDVIRPELDSTDDEIRSQAIYSARFICSDEPTLRRILSIYKKEPKQFKDLARNVLTENTSVAMQKILKGEGDAGDLGVLEIRIDRGDLDARNRVWSMFFAGDLKKVTPIIESTITHTDLIDFAKFFKTEKNEAVRMEMAKIIVKKLAKSRRDPEFVQLACWTILKDNVKPNDAVWKFIGEKLKVKIQKPKQVWQSKYKNRAVDDNDMKVAKDKEPNIDGSFVSLFNGKNLDGWHTTTGSATYTVKDGCVFGETDPKMKQNSFLITDRKDYKDFIFTCEFKWNEHGNSGVIFRGQRNDKGSVYGPQAEIDDAPRAWSGGIYNEGAEWKYSLSRKDQQLAREAIKLNDWNRMTIYCKGDVMKTWINGVPVSDLEWKGTKAGFFGLQIHAGMKCKVLWRDIKIKELK